MVGVMDKLIVFIIISTIQVCHGFNSKCSVATQPHATECNKYLKCISKPMKSVTWITLNCPEGLIYDKNLKSCAIPDDKWECLSDSEDEITNDDENVYGIENLKIIEDDEDDSDDFLEVIDEDLNPSEYRSIDSSEESSGDGEIYEVVTPSSSTMQMITNQQLQRLTQLMQTQANKNYGFITSGEITADDLNSFLSTQQIQSNSPEYQKFNFHSNRKTAMPENGKIHPEILNQILQQQNKIKGGLNYLTTLSMDATTPKSTRNKPVLYYNRDPVTEIKLKSGQSLDGLGSHQIVVNRPEGSVLFNVPTPMENKQQSPHLSEDILKTILEISKHMVTQNHHQKQDHAVSYAPQPFYYGVPIPFLSPQNNGQSYYDHNYRNNLTEILNSLVKSKSKPDTVETVSMNFPPKINQKADIVTSPDSYYNHFQNYHPSNQQQNYGQGQKESYQNFINNQQRFPSNQQSFMPQQGFINNNQQSFLNNQRPPGHKSNPNQFYQNYPTMYSSDASPLHQQLSPYQSYPNPNKNHNTDSLNYNNQRYDFDSAYYGNRPFVPESSAPSYVEHEIRPKPFQKESYETSYENYDEDEIDERFYDEEEDFETPTKKSEKEELICTPVLQRQANKTDCMGYYVCNSKTKEVLSYTCPVFTAFNDLSKYCDQSSYPACKKVKDRESSSYHNQMIFDEATKALEQVKKESQKVERIASMVRQESEKIYKRRQQYQPIPPTQSSHSNNQHYTHIQRIPKPIVTKRQRPTMKQTVRVPVSQPKPQRKRKPLRTKKKKVKCYDTGNIVDPESPTSYWHCFRGADGRMKRVNRKCNAHFIFCSKSRFCSPPGRC
ncbi:CLUMA_CG014512, isoform A [Clunio marinus]|uniref:CLUMA_CG014512, isoform A n=1 Tax=Clunio marinus TaxID=568069 RepID=A0A1J1ISS4_9DIPT|nr:CLUMA_CG014512, isoform A [Clunio marinus]